MNPVVTPVDNDLVIFQLTDEDRARLKDVKLKSAEGDLDDIAFHKMCIMQAVSLVTDTPEAWNIERVKELQVELSHLSWNDRRRVAIEKELEGLYLGTNPICVSGEIINAMIHLNDRNITPQQRGKLKRLVETILNTCPVKRTTKQLKTKVRVEERRLQTPEYRKAEKERAEIFTGLHKVSFAEGMKRVEKAARLFKVTAPT